MDNNNVNNNTTSGGRLTYNHIKNFTEELERVKNFCKEIKKGQEENCIMENEKRTFDKMKNEYIKLSADMNIMKEDIKEILANYHSLVKRVSFLEEENKNLRKHNKNLVKLIQNRAVANATNPNSARNFNENVNVNNENYIIDNIEPQGNNYISDYTENFNRVQNKYNTANANYNSRTSNNANNSNNINTNVNRENANTNANYYLNTMPSNLNNLNNQMNIDNNFSTPLSDLSAFNNINNTSSNEMLGNIHSNLSNADYKKSKKRFLIQKENLDYNENYPLQSQMAAKNPNREMNSNMTNNNLGNLGNNNTNPASFQQSGMSNRINANSASAKNDFNDRLDYVQENAFKNNNLNNYNDHIGEDFLNNNTNYQAQGNHPYSSSSKQQMINNYN